jgi:hypothetical protein
VTHVQEGIELRIFFPSTPIDQTEARSAESRMVGEMQIGHTKLGLHQRLSPFQHPVILDQTC